MDSVLLDTSFCIRLLKSNDDLHQNAKEYFKYFLVENIEIYLSTIVIAEYSVKDDPSNLPLEFSKIIPFDYLDGKSAGEFHSYLIQNNYKNKELDRVAIKDDCKLLAQIYNRKISAYITKDKKSFKNLFEPIQKIKNFNIRLIDFEIPFNEFKGELF